MGFSVSDGGPLRVLGDARGACSPAPPTCVSPTFLGMLRDWRRFNREARALIGMNGTAPSLGHWLEQQGFSRHFIERLIVPQASRRLVGRPGADVELPGQLHGRVLRQPRHVQPPRPAQVADGRAAARAATSRRSRRPGATGCGCAAPVRRIERLPDRVRIEADGCESEDFDQVVIATHSDQALAMLGRPERGRARDPRRDPLPAQRSRPPHRRGADAAPPRRLVELELPPRRRAGRAGSTVTYWMNNLQRLRAERDYFVTLNRGEEIDPAKVLRRFEYDHPVYTAEGVAAQARHAEISGVRPHPLLRRLLGLGLPRGRRGQRPARLRGDRPASRSRPVPRRVRR